MHQLSSRAGVGLFEALSREGKSDAFAAWLQI
jgi:hypothetical protein